MQLVEHEPEIEPAEYRAAREEFELLASAADALADINYAEAVYRAALEAGALPDTPAQRVDSNSRGSLGGVGSLRIIGSGGSETICTGAAIGNSHVLTAAHCFDSDNDGALDATDVTFFLNNGGSPSASINVASVAIHPSFGGFTNTGANDDLAVLTLATPVPPATPTYSLRGGPMTIGETIELVGYGASGQGDVVGVEVAPDYHVKRVGQNQVDLLVLDDEGSGNYEIFIYDFDGPAGNGILGGPTLGNSTETVVRGGDSGAPAFVGGTIAGVSTFEFVLPGSTGASGEFGSLGGGVILDAPQVEWIASITGAPLPDPPTAPELTEVNLSTAANTLQEGGPSTLVTISRTGDVSSSLTVQYEVSGTASANDYAGLSGVVIIPAGESSANIGIAVVDDDLRESTETVVLTLVEDPGYRLGPASVAIIDITDNDGPPIAEAPSNPDAPIVNITTDPTSIGEASSGFRITVTREGDILSDLIIHYSVGGSASEGSDFLQLPGKTTIPAGTPFGHITIIPLDDGISESTEVVSITLIPDSDYSIGDVATTTVAIVDDEPPLGGPQLPVVEINASLNSVPEAAGFAPFTISRSGDLSSPLTVNYAIRGSASNGSDYAALSGIATIPAGSDSLQLGITTQDDTLVENNESVMLSLLPNVSYSVGPDDSITVVIVDDDEPGSTSPSGNLPSVTIITDPTSTEEGSRGARVTFARTGSLLSSLVVRYTVGGTASPGTDYDNLAGTVVIPPGTPFANITVMPLSDSQVESTESVVIAVAPDSAYNVGVVSRTTVRILDGEVTSGGGNTNEPSTGSLPKVSVTRDVAVVNENSAGSRITIARDSHLNLPLAVHYSLSGTATPGVDYARLSGVAIIPAGVPFVTLDLEPLDDDQPEATESVVLSIDRTSNYEVGAAASVNVSIVDNDEATTGTGDAGGGAGNDGGSNGGGGGNTGDGGVGEPPASGEFTAVAEGTNAGIVRSGSFLDTQASDNHYEVLEETSLSPWLDHTWTFDVPQGNVATFVIEASHNSSSDMFWVNFSADSGRTWTTMTSITKTADNDQSQAYRLPNGTSGEILVQVRDSHRFGDRHYDQLFVDKIAIIVD